MQNVLLNSRAVTVDLDGAAAPFAALKAILAKFEEFEASYQNNTANVPNLSAKAIIVTGKHPYQVYQFTVTTNMSAGTFTGTYVGTLP